MIKKMRLNPCFNGRYSLRKNLNYDKFGLACLNPCFNGRYSLRVKSIRRYLRMLS